MTKHSIQDEYCTLLEGYVLQREETLLTKAATLGRDLAGLKVPAEEVALIHGEAARRLAEILPEKDLREAMTLVSFPLMELLMAYGLFIHKQAEEDVRRTRDFLRSIIETAQTIILVLDVNGRVVSFNPYMEKICGYQLEEVKGRDWFETFLPESIRDEIRGVFRQTMEHNHTGGHVGEITTREGESRQIEWYNKALKDPEGRVLGVLATGQDVTERRETEKELMRHREHLEKLVKDRTAELEAAHEELLRKERLAALGHLIGTVSHEIRNPLGTIHSSIFSVSERVRGRDEAVDRALARAERNIQRCDRIIEDLLSYTRRQAPCLKATDIDDWLNEVLDEMPVPAAVRLTRKLHCGVGLPVDRERLRRCIVNVVENAWQAMTAGPAELTVETRVLDRRLQIRVGDTGPGIPPELMGRIFDPLFSTKTFGMGMGLPIVKQIMEQHSGGVEVESREGKGVLVTLWLPCDHTTRLDEISMLPGVAGREVAR